jgi:hypothetical protein
MKIKIYKTVVYSVVLYACETESLALGEYKLRVSEIGGLRIFESKNFETRGGQGKLQN